MNQLFHQILCSVLVGCGILVSGADGQDRKSNATAVSYHRDIRPIFVAHCVGCHQPAKKGGGYDMTDIKQLFAGGQSGETAIQPKDPANSYLVDLVEPVDGSADMPLDKAPLSTKQIDLIKRWISEGAVIDASSRKTRVINTDNPPLYQSPPVITSIDASPDGNWIAVSGYHEVLIHHVDGSGIAKRLVGLAERVEQVSFSADGKRLAVAGGSPGRFGEIQIWDVEKGNLILSEVIGNDTLYGVSWSSDGKTIAFGCPDTNLRAVNSETGNEVLFNGAHNDWVLDTVFSRTNEYIITVSRDRSMKLVKFDTQRFIDNITSITPGALKGGLNAVDRHPTRDELLCGGADGIPKVYRMLRTKARKIGDDFNLIRAYPGLRGRVNDVGFSRDGKMIAAVSSHDGKGQFKIYETDSGKVIADVSIADGGLFALTFIPKSNQVCVAGFNGLLSIYDSTNGKLIKAFDSVPIQKQTR